MPQIVYIGKHATSLVRQNPQAWEAGLRARYPTLSDKAVLAIRQAELGKRPPRVDGEVYHLFGRDILTENPTALPVWPYISPRFQDQIVHPQRGIRPVAERAQLIEADLPLAQTFVFSHWTQFVQEVSEADLLVIRQHDQVRRFFCRFEDVGYWSPKSPWELPVLASVPFESVDEFRRFEAEQKSKPVWTGR